MHDSAMGADSHSKSKLKTPEEVRAEFCRGGQSITRWAAKHGYPAYLVQQVLSGRARCLRGKSHEIAVLLQIKDGYIVEKPENQEAAL